VEYKRNFAKNYFDKIMHLRQKQVRDREKFIFEIILGFDNDFFTSFQRKQLYRVLAEYFALSTRYNIDFLDYLVVNLTNRTMQAMCYVSRYIIGITLEFEEGAIMTHLEYLRKHNLSESFERKIKKIQEAPQ
jgi:hypothetical protein